MNIEKAQKLIAQVLQALEKETGCTVEAVNIHSINVTAFDDESQQLMQSVQIDLKRPPGTRWQT